MDPSRSLPVGKCILAVVLAAAVAVFIIRRPEFDGRYCDTGSAAGVHTAGLAGARTDALPPAAIREHQA